MMVRFGYTMLDMQDHFSTYSSFLQFTQLNALPEMFWLFVFVQKLSKGLWEKFGYHSSYLNSMKLVCRSRLKIGYLAPHKTISLPIILR